MMKEKQQKQEMEMLEDAAKLASSVWTKIDFDKVDFSRDLNDEFASRIGTAAYSGSVKEFVSKLAKKMGVRSLKQDSEVLEIIEKYDIEKNLSNSFLRVVRDNNQLVVLEMKKQRGDL